MSVEGMWFIVSGSVVDPERLAGGGIVVLETGRAFGGDSAIAYSGSYEVEDGRIHASVRTWPWNPEALGPDGTSVFGMKAPFDVTIEMNGMVRDDRIVGNIMLEGTMVTCELRKIAALPG